MGKVEWRRKSEIGMFKADSQQECYCSDNCSCSIHENLLKSMFFTVRALLINTYLKFMFYMELNNLKAIELENPAEEHTWECMT